MMGWSDNEATNVLIEQLGMEAVNDRLARLGLGVTRLRRRMMDLVAARRGDENVATPAELNKLMEAIYAGKGLSSERAKDIVSVAATPKWGSGRSAPSPFRLPLPDTLVVADKPGELEGVRCVTALVYLPERPYAATIMTTYLRSDDEGEAAIRDISAAVFQTLDRLGRASEPGPDHQRQMRTRPIPRPRSDRSSKVSRRRMSRARRALDQDLRRARAQVVVGGHGEAVGARVPQDQQVAGTRLRSSRSCARKSPVSQTGRRRRRGASGRRGALRPARCGGRRRRARAAAGRSCRRPRSRSACRGSPSRRAPA